MIMTIEIPNPPKGYANPKRRPLYIPYGNTIVLVGNSWVRAVDICGESDGGRIHIYCIERGKGKINEQTSTK